MVKIEFNTDNAAFEDPTEISRILRKLADRLEYVSNNEQIPIMDINGNKIGRCEVVYSNCFG
jgi:hypothetical protein